jgi:integrase
MKLKVDYNRSGRLSENGDGPISIRLLINSKYYFIPTGERTTPRCWDHQQDKVNRKDPYHKSKNIISDNLIEDIKNINTAILVEGRRVTIQEIKRALKGENDTTYTFNVFYKENMERSRFGKLTHLSFVDRKRTYDILNEFNPSISFGDLNTKMVLKFRAYLESKYSQNTVTKHLKNIKTITFLAKLQGHIRDGLVSDPFSGIVIKKMKSLKKFSLTFAQVEELKALNYTEADGPIFHVWNMFMFSCRTAFRVSDVLTLKRNEIVLTKENGYLIKKEPQKRGAGTYRSLLKLTKEIFGDNLAEEIILQYLGDKCRDTLVFPEMSEQKVNLYMEKIFANIQTEHKVTFHIARHTCATHMAAKDIGLHKIMRIGGWLDSRTIQGYVNLSNDLLGNYGE